MAILKHPANMDFGSPWQSMARGGGDAGGGGSDGGGDNDSQGGLGGIGGYGTDADSAENSPAGQSGANASAAAGDPAGYGDMTSTDVAASFGGYGTKAQDLTAAIAAANAVNNFANPMNPYNPVDRALASLGLSIGLGPNPAQASQFSVMAPFAATVPGALTAMNVSQNISKGMNPLGALGIAAVDTIAGKSGLGSLANTALGIAGEPSLGEQAMSALGMTGTTTDLASVTGDIGTTGTTSTASPSSTVADIGGPDGGGDFYSPAPIANTAPQYTQVAQAPLAQLAAPTPFETRVPEYNPYLGNFATYGQDLQMHDFFKNA